MLEPLTPNPTLAQILARVFTLVVTKAGGKATVARCDDRAIELSGILCNGEYLVYLTLGKRSWENFTVTRFLSTEMIPNSKPRRYMPAEWTLLYSLKVGKTSEGWEVSSGSNLLSLFEAHTKWSKLEGYLPVFERKDNS